MPIEDYRHWNEDQHRIWWEEEGKHIEEPPEPEPGDCGCGHPECMWCG